MVVRTGNSGNVILYFNALHKVFGTLYIHVFISFLRKSTHKLRTKKRESLSPPNTANKNSLLIQLTKIKQLL